MKPPRTRVERAGGISSLNCQSVLGGKGSGIFSDTAGQV